MGDKNLDAIALLITRVIATRPNPDKFNGLSEFHKAGVESIASAKTAATIPGVDAYKRYFFVKLAKAFTDETYPKVEAVKTTYTGKTVIVLKSGETITLFELAQPGISSDQTVVRIDKTGDLIVGDLVHTKTHAWLEGGVVDGKATPTLAGWKADLNELTRLGKVYGGRGEFVGVKQAVAQEIVYLDKANAVVTAYVKALGDKSAELSDPAKQGDHYKAIQGELAKAFPDRPCLIWWGIAFMGWCSRSWRGIEKSIRTIQGTDVSLYTLPSVNQVLWEGTAI